MRDIKFRARRLDNGEWAYGDLYQEKFPFENKLKETCIVEYRPDLCLVSGAPPNNHWWLVVDGKTVGQFIGLKDKKGVDIYKGDVVLDDDGTNWEVKWNDQNAQFIMSANKIYDEFIHCGQSQSDGPVHCDTIEVIGNIYENESLKK